MASLNPRQGALGMRLAAHLLRRTTYRIDKARIEQFAAKTADEAVEQLFSSPPLNMEQPIDPETGQPWINNGTEPVSEDFKLRVYVRSWWLDEARRDLSIGHKMQFFLHSNFVTTFNTLGSRNFYDHLALNRFFAIGNFKKLAYKMVVDNLMLVYLNNTENDKDNPNQNFAREFLELFTIGKGPETAPFDYTFYTEDDVIQTARVFTGFKAAQRTAVYLDPETGIYRGRIQANQHDTGQKKFSHRFNNQTINGGTNGNSISVELQQFVDMIFNQDATARFICRKLYRFFVSRNISDEIENDIIVPLAQNFKNSGYELAPTLKQLLKSVHFFDEDDSDNTNEIIGALMKSPLELVLQSMNFFFCPVPDPLTQPLQHYGGFYGQNVSELMLSRAGMTLFAPSDVAGYPAYHQEPGYHRAWFDSTTIIARYILPAQLLSGMKVVQQGQLGTIISIAPFTKVNVPDAGSAEALVTWYCQRLLPEFPDADRMDYFINDILLDNLPAADWYYEWQTYLTTNNDTEVRVGLRNLITAIMYSPEYQLM